VVKSGLKKVKTADQGNEGKAEGENAKEGESGKYISLSFIYRDVESVILPPLIRIL
jgi:hypothetical protein